MSTYICENCGVTHAGKYGSGRFCSPHCSRQYASLIRRSEVNRRVSDTLKGKHKDIDKLNLGCKQRLDKLPEFVWDADDPLRCPECGKLCKNYIGLSKHFSMHLRSDEKLSNKFVSAYNGKELVKLDINYKQLDEYKQAHPVCEICGRDFSHYQTVNGNKRKMGLSVDHDHSTNKFRGMLCVCCNRSLEWFIRYQKQIDAYLTKDNGD